ncbi:hypothetical protein BaRGS_00021137 [Batillaria attramentaria]|uniref:NodB homology domain-containing protein n=1 Tax=Batillaria attramentaria TaxID=370345 RepID=A0ABD0KKS6_9CAEN
MKTIGRASFTLVILVTLTSLASAQTDQCKPDDNCSPPDCRCWNDQAIPGGLETSETPQVVLVTFEYAINSAYIDPYRAIFENTVNPNNCPAVGTFFVQETNTQMDLVKELHDAGHEIGVTTIDGTNPETEEQWVSNLQQVKAAVVAAGVPEPDVVGVRAPQLMPGGLNEFTALAQEGFLYDASCSTSRFDGDQSELLWPYTYDFAPGPSCDSGEGPEAEFPGRWQILVADLEFQGTKCASPQACIGVTTERDAFDLFYNSFIKHYEGTRSPFMIVINADWALTPFKLEGTRQFVEYVRAAFEDTWVLSVSQALEWVRNPVNNANATSGYSPWAC